MVSVFFTSFVVGFSGAMMPGPLLAMTLAQVARYGFWAGPAITFGHVIAEAAVVAALSAGLGRLLRQRAVIGAVGIGGGAFLAWMGWDILSSVAGYGLPEAGSMLAADGIRLASVADGLVVSVSSPHWVLWWATIGSAYVVWALQRGARFGIIAFYVGHILSDIVWYVAVSFGVAAGGLFVSDVVLQGVLAVCGLALLALGAFFAIGGVRTLVRGGRRWDNATRGSGVAAHNSDVAGGAAGGNRTGR